MATPISIWFVIRILKTQHERIANSSALFQEMLIEKTFSGVSPCLARRRSSPVIHIYIYIYIYIYPPYVGGCVHQHVYVYLCMRTLVHIYIFLMCVCVYTNTCMYTRACVHSYTYILSTVLGEFLSFVFSFPFFLIYIYIYPLCVCVYTHVYIFAYIYVSIHIYVLLVHQTGLICVKMHLIPRIGVVLRLSVCICRVSFCLLMV